MIWVSSSKNEVLGNKAYEHLTLEWLHIEFVILWPRVI